MNVAILAGAAGVYLVNQWLLKGTGHSFFHHHFNDVLAGLILLAYSNLIASLAPRVAAWIGSVPGAIVIILGASCAWELAAPLVLPHSRGDPWDFVAYGTGAALYLTVARAGATPAAAGQHWPGDGPGSGPGANGVE